MTNITKTHLDSYIATNSLIKGKTYEISDCHASLFGGNRNCTEQIDTWRNE